MKGKRNLPVYTIEIFRNKNPKSTFYVRALEDHLGEFTFTHDPHRHDNYLILILTHGSGVHSIDFVDYEVKPFTAFFLTPGQAHAWKFSKDAKGFVIFFTAAFYKMDRRQRALSEFPFFHTMNNACCLYMDSGKESWLITLLQEMVVENNLNQKGRDELLRNSLDMVLIRMSRYYQQEDHSQPSFALSMQVRKFETLVDEHFLTLKLPRDYADRMNITPKHLNDICKRALNKTATELIHDRLLLEAKRELAYSGLSVKQIADKLGFSDKSYFIRFVKKNLGETPEHFREKHPIVHLHP